jgi:hypothetical protein
VKGLSLRTKDLQQSSNPEWRKAAGGIDLKPRKKRFTGPTSESKAWARETSKGPGRFFQTSRIINWLNWRGHHMAKAGIASTQRTLGMVETGLLTAGKDIPSPCLVRLTRYGPKDLDDNEALMASMKHFRDGVADWIGRDDSGTDGLRFEYRTVKAKWYGVRIELEAA